MTFRSSFDAQSAADWLLTPSGFHAATNRYAKLVSSLQLGKQVSNADCAIGQSGLPSTCPVCEHSPVASEDCKPHKSLRTTIKVFLRTEEKKREALRSKEAKDTTPPDTPIEPEPTPTAVPTPLSPTAPATNKVTQGDIKCEPPPSVDVAEVAPVKPEGVELLQEAQQDIPQPSIEVRYSLTQSFRSGTDFIEGNCA